MHPQKMCILTHVRSAVASAQSRVLLKPHTSYPALAFISCPCPLPLPPASASASCLCLCLCAPTPPGTTGTYPHMGLALCALCVLLTRAQAYLNGSLAQGLAAATQQLAQLTQQQGVNGTEVSSKLRLWIGFFWGGGAGGKKGRRGVGGESVWQ